MKIKIKNRYYQSGDNDGQEDRDHDDVEESEEGKKKKRTGTTPMWRRARKKTLTLP
jgi:hypothetical protein